MQRAEILKAALELSADEGEKLVEELSASLKGFATPEIEQAWADEIERRMDEADAGKMESIPWSQVRTEASEAIRRGRGR